MTSPSAPSHLSPTQQPVRFTDIPNMVLIESLCTNSLLRLSESSKGLRDAYDGHIQEAELFWHQENYPGSFSEFLQRQPGLKVLKLEISQEEAELLPYLTRAITERPLQFLQVLHYKYHPKQLILQAEIDTFVDALQDDALPLLESTGMHGPWEEGAIPIFLRGFKDGACPRLHTIKGLEIPYRGWYVDDDGDFEEYRDNDDDETEACAKALSEMLETRRSLGTCVGLKQLPMYSMYCIPGHLCSRMLRAALPTLEVLPEFIDWDEDEDMLRVFAELGAPCVKRREVECLGVLQELINKPGGFEQLQNVWLYFPWQGKKAPAILREFQRFSKLLTDGFWPHLQELTVSEIVLGVEGWQVLIDALIRRRGVVGRGLQELMFWKIGLTDEDIDVLAGAFTEGCFSDLKKLSLTREDGVTDRGAKRLAEVLHHAPLLETLRLNMTGIKASGCEALALAAATGCPAMTNLVLPHGDGEET